jgi:hypothetical protein
MVMAADWVFFIVFVFFVFVKDYDTKLADCRPFIASNDDLQRLK